jgi:hypothetical protein
MWREWLSCLVASSELISFGLCRCRYTTQASDRIVQQLRLSAWARVFRRLQRSTDLTEQQRAAILRRQIAVGIRSSMPQGQASRKTTMASSPGSASGDADSDSGRHAGGKSRPRLASQLSATASTVLPPSSVVSAPLSYYDVQDDPNFVQYESADSGDEHRPAPEGELVVKVRAFAGISLPILISVTTACAKRTGATASVERMRREPDRAVSPEC